MKLTTKLQRAVSRQLGRSGEELKETLEDVRNHGADTGWPGFTYYSDTIEFFKRNKAAIVEELEQLADDLGEEPIAMVKNFRCLSDSTTKEIAATMYGGKVDDMVANGLALFALEQVASQFDE